MAINHDEAALTIYADGASLWSPVRGGIGYRFLFTDADGNEVHKDYCPPGFKGASNNEMELMACIEALEEAVTLPDFERFSGIDIYTDSQYVSENLKRAKWSWPKNGWVTDYGRGTPVENVELWKRLIKAENNMGKRVRISWVRGHAKNIHNKAVDKLAKTSAKSAIRPPISVTSVRRKRTDNKTKLGSIRPQGQRLTIRIIEVEWMRTRRIWKYRTEVISQYSDYSGNIDRLYSKESLRDGHIYEVTLNRDANYPKIQKIIKEITEEQ